MSLVRVCLVTLLCLTSLSSVPAQEPDRDTMQRVQRLYAEGAAAYEAQDYPAAIEAFREASELMPHESILYNLACCYALDSQPEAALDALQRAVEAGFADRGLAESDTDLDSIRDQPRFAELVGRIPGMNATHETLELPGDAEVPRVRWYATLPPDHDPAASYPVVLALPPGPGTQAMVQAGLGRYWEAEAARRGYLVLSVELQGQRMAGRAAPIVDGVLAAAAERYGADPGRVILTGFSNGGVGAMIALIETEARPFRGLIGLPAAAPRGASLDGLDLAGFPVLLLAGEQDGGWVQGMRHTASELEALGAVVELEILAGQGHVIDVDPARLFDWMDAALASDR
jgi:hypothetical protein